MNLYTVLVHIHSVLRWVLLLLILISVVMALTNRQGLRGAMKPALWAMVAAHIQLLLGLVLYFTSQKVIFSAGSMKDPVLRFFLVEHLLVMVIAIALITIGYVRAKRTPDVSKSNKRIAVFYIISLLLILSRIPWPFMKYGGWWY